MPQPKWVIEGLFEQDALVMLVGPPGSFKSFLAIDMALCLATGRDWNGRAVKPSNVLYALGEGKASLLKRVKAWQWHKKLTQAEQQLLSANFKVTFDVPQLATQREVARFENDMDADDLKPTVLIIDTLARSFVGKNENDPMDAGMWVESADRLRQRGITVIVLHHTKKNTEFGLQYRGTTAFLGAMDTSFVLHRNPEGFKGYSKLSCNKQKDHIEPPDIWLQSEHVSPPNIEGSIVLTEVQPPTEEETIRRAEDEAMMNDMIQLLLGQEFQSDRARARELAEKVGISESAAQSRILRARRKNE